MILRKNNIILFISYFQNFVWFQFYIFKFYPIMCVSLLPSSIDYRCCLLRLASEIKTKQNKTKKKLVSKILVDSNFTFSSYAWLCVCHYSHDYRPCLLRLVSGITHHHTPKMVLRSVTFSTPKSDNLQVHKKIQNVHLLHVWTSWEVLFVAQQAMGRIHKNEQLLSQTCQLVRFSRISYGN